MTDLTPIECEARLMGFKKEDFWRMVDRSSPDGCWLWTGPRNEDGYGRLRFNKAPTGAHRIAYQLLVGSIPTGLCVCHKCDVRHCVNPQHLFAASQQENIADMHKKGRAKVSHPGDQNPNVKLTVKQVLAIREDPRNYRDIAKDYPIAKSMVGNIKTGLAWRGIGE